MADAPTGRDYRETVFLPDLPGDPFPLRAGLPKKEPERVKRWAEIGLYHLLRKEAADRPKVVFHDGPPYANGPIHIGHAENKILKDFVVRTKQMAGYDCDYVPGWDCHGLPIEWKVEEDFRKAGRKKADVPAVEFRRACRAYADKWIPLQREEFKRLGIEADWDKYYTTMSFEAEAAIAREFLRVVRTGLVYRGSKPVMWSPVERTSLAEAEVEYAEKTSPTIWVKFPVVGHRPAVAAGATRAKKIAAEYEETYFVSDKPISVVIWTTTPWTIPGNRAISFSPAIKYGVYQVESIEQGLAFEPWVKVGEQLAIADKLAEDVMRAAKAASWKRVADFDPSGLICAHPLRDWRPSPLAGEGREGGRSDAQAPERLHAPHPPTPAPQGGGGVAYEFDVPLLAGDHVTDDAGTGFVHTAPGHGQDDFNIWVANFGQEGIPFTVDEDGRFTKEAPGFEGLEILQLEGKNLGKDGPANKAVMDKLIEVGALLARGQLKHSYPHSWRSKAPLIFRNTPQWFIALDKPFHGGKTLRQIALDEIDRVDWGQKRTGETKDYNRIRGMIEDRPDWLVSRQRAWGVPLPIFVKKSDGSILQDDEVDARIFAAMREGGADVWWATPAQEFLGSKYKAEEFEKVEDILDVWFDSGSTHAFVIGNPEAPTRPSFVNPVSTIYLEGSDQHRGWFHSSLLESCATRGRAPYDEVITHGFTMDEEGKKMSKSIGNTVEPQKVAEQNGIEILRLLIAAAEYGDDLRLGKTILDQSSEMYRKLRNTLRYLLGATKGFEESERVHAPPLAGELSSAQRETEGGVDNTPLPLASLATSPASGGGEALPLLERWLLHRLWELDRTVRDAYATYQFRVALSAIVEFCNVDLSAFYVDVRKDALYCDAPSSFRRRACRTVLDETFSRLTAWLAPILPFTAEEAWLVRFPETMSVHLRTFPETPASWEDDFAGEEMAKLREARAVVTGALEVARRDKVIGAALEAAPRVFVADDGLRAKLRAVDFAELCITSGISIVEGDGPADAFRLPETAGIAVVVEKAPGVKCARSWKYFDPATADPAYPDITPRDAEAVRTWDAARG
ncbi:MAG TPA: isoleucine--tRNA ligase [Vitreimonas sp.]|uniref:isoleucine--tRNA ligase n=1 Tax=Vitreimonas sp. TaxID=3069702 RepID=UPI002D6546FA|nr:isoleucine--tRNA ligase [Vitreimonas sp.]HYD86488.1 isoleucine--tRNA ligase [Vitreimonas sp.]